MCQWMNLLCCKARNKLIVQQGCRYVLTLNASMNGCTRIVINEKVTFILKKSRSHICLLLWDLISSCLAIRARYGCWIAHDATEVTIFTNMWFFWFWKSFQNIYVNFLLPNRINWWIPALPYALVILIYDEVRTFLKARFPNKFLLSNY